MFFIINKLRDEQELCLVKSDTTTFNTLTANHTISRDASSYHMANHAILRGHRYQASKRNARSTVDREKRPVIFKLNNKI